MNHVKEERSLGSLFSELRREVQRLIRDEIALFQSEMSQKISRGLKNIGFLAAGGAVLYAGALTVVAALVLLLGAVMPAWISALLVGSIVLGTGYVLVKKGINELKQSNFTPRETISTLKGDKEWQKKEP